MPRNLQREQEKVSHHLINLICLGGKKRKGQKKAAKVSVDLHESMKILNFEAGEEITSEILSDRYFDYLKRNDPETDGSIYLTAKIENAKDALVAEYNLRIIDPEEQVEEEQTEAMDEVEQQNKQEPKE